MNQEFNNLKTENIKTTFSNNTNNLATSDELQVDPIYVRKMRNSYAASKKGQKVITITGISLLLTATAILSGNIISNVFIVNPPTIVESNFLILENTDTLSYNFTLTNKGNYKVTFKVSCNKETLYTLDCSNPDNYTGEILNIGLDKKVHYDISFTNRFDYIKSILNGNLYT